MRGMDPCVQCDTGNHMVMSSRIGGFFRPIRTAVVGGHAFGALGDRRAATAIEFALIAPVLFMLTLGTVELGLCFTADIVLRNATSSASRLGRTGYVANNSTRDAMVLAQISQEVGAILDPSRISLVSKAYGGFEDIGRPEPFVDVNGNGKRDDGESYTDVNGNGKYDLDRGKDGLGGTSQIVIYTVTYPWSFFTPLVGRMISSTGTILLTATAVIQNEPY